MRKERGLFIVMFFLVLLAYCGFAQSQQAILAQLAQQKVACRYDWDCRTLGEELIKLDQNICVGQQKFYDGRSDPLLPKRPYLLLELVGKIYTEYLQIGYKITFKCGKSGYCEPDKVDYDSGLIQCRYGCLVTPVEKNGKVYSNFCVCLDGQVPGTKVFCDYSRGRHVYYYDLSWTCEKSVKIAGYCPVGSKCEIVNPRTEEWTCAPLEGSEILQTASSSENEISYSLLIPGNLASKPIKVAAIKNGRIIAERAISSMSAIEYINKYGPVNAANAYAFAQKVGLTTLASSTISSGTTTRTLSSSTSTRTLNSATSSVNSYRTAYSYRSNSGTYGSTYTYSNSYRNYANSTNSYGTYSSSSNTSSSYYRPTTTYSYTTYTKPTSSYSNYSRTYPTYSSYSYRRYSISSSSSRSSYSYNSRSNSTAGITYTPYRYYYARRFS